LLIFFTEVIKFYWLMLLYPGELYRLLDIYVNDSQNLAFPTSHFIIELLPFDYLSTQKKCQQKNAFQEE
jgi:hypothetical protein